MYNNHVPLFVNVINKKPLFLPIALLYYEYFAFINILHRVSIKHFQVSASATLTFVRNVTLNI